MFWAVPINTTNYTQYVYLLSLQLPKRNLAAVLCLQAFWFGQAGGIHIDFPAPEPKLYLQLGTF